MEEVKKQKKYLNMLDIESVEDTEYAEIEAWGGVIRVGTLDAGTMLRFVAENEVPATKRTAGLRMLVDSLVDENGKRIGSREHLKILEKKNAAVIDRVCSRILTLNGFGRNPFDLQVRIKKANELTEGREPALTALVAEMRKMAEDLEAALADQKSVTELLDGKPDVKNG